MRKKDLATFMVSCSNWLRPVLVVPFRTEEEIVSRTEVMDLDSLADSDGRLTSLSGLVRHCSDIKEEATFIVSTSFRAEANMEEGDVSMDCNFHNRMGACYKDVAGYVSSVFTDGTYRGVAVSNSPKFVRSLNQEMKRRTSVVFLVDLLDIIETPFEEPFRKLCQNNGYDSQRALEELVWGRGSVCGSVGLRADLSQNRLETSWLSREEQERPPFLSGEDILAVAEGDGIEYMKSRDILCGPVCTGAMTKGLRRDGETIVEPCSDITVVINASVKGAVEVLSILDL